MCAPAADEPAAATAGEPSAAATGEPSAAATEMSATAYADVSTAAASHLGGCDIGRQCRRAERRDSRKRDDALV